VLLSDYQWSGNPRGMHNPMVYRGPQPERVLRLQLGWYKMTAAGTEFLNDCVWLLQNNVTPIIRVYRPSPGAMPVDEGLVNAWRAYANVGVKWFEFYNEPNLASEWPPLGIPIDHRNIESAVGPIMENWLNFADLMISWGCYPGFPALAEAATSDAGSVGWMDSMLAYVRDRHRQRFINIINNGLWMSVHPSTLNHFYQDVPGQPNIPRDQAQYDGNTIEGWHFEYPYDPICQATDPGRTVFGGTALTPYGDPNGINAMGIAFHYRLGQWFDAGTVPVVGTEGGVYPTPVNGGERLQQDRRYPWYDANAHGEATVAMFNWIAQVAPPWHFGVSLWKEDEYYDAILPALQRMEQVPQIRRVTPPLSSGEPGDYNGLVLGGPGPIRGQPTFHVVVLAPGLNPDWFFEAARSYYNTYRPIVAPTWDYIRFIPRDRSLAMTVIAPLDMIETMRSVIQQQYPNVLFDLIAYGDHPGLIGETLNQRVLTNRRYG
jgi:hypothetical protein